MFQEFTGLISLIYTKYYIIVNLTSTMSLCNPTKKTQEFIFCYFGCNCYLSCLLIDSSSHTSDSIWCYSWCTFIQPYSTMYSLPTDWLPEPVVWICTEFLILPKCPSSTNGCRTVALCPNRHQIGHYNCPNPICIFHIYLWIHLPYHVTV